MVIHIYGCCLYFRRDFPSFDGLSETGGSIISEASHHGTGCNIVRVLPLLLILYLLGGSFSKPYHRAVPSTQVNMIKIV